MFQHQDHDSRELSGDFTKKRMGRHDDGRGRPFERAALRLVLLQMIAEMPRHATELIKAIEDRLGGAYSPSPGVIHPTLLMLEDLGYASLAPCEDGNKRYAVTAKGTVVLDGNRATVDAIFERMRSVRSNFVAPQILRPMETLKQALRKRLSQSDIDVDGIRAMAAAIDAATVAVARA
jgi:DNA-binding PadR family transcriptional regulator